jgi:pimeloyl-ACP methyl ester carboxylesterase
MNWNEQLQAFPPERAQTSMGRVEYRRSGAYGGDSTAPAVVLLHGIGSASASWVAQLAGLRQGAPVLAWNAPGYGGSTPLAAAQPLAGDYAARVWAWLDALRIGGPVTLVGHSLGALMAASAARLAPQRVARLVLLAPAQGYARADASLRQSKLDDRLSLLSRLGAEGLAQSRGATMLSPAAAPEMVAFIRHVMAGIDPAGYTQAAQMLARGDLLADLAPLTCPRLVASGSADSVTPAEGCQTLAAAAGAAYLSLGAVGHACALEAAALVNSLLLPSGRDAGGLPS